MSDTCEVDDVEYNNLVYLQTLTSFSQKAETYIRSGKESTSYRKLTVPKYIQAVDIDDGVTEDGILTNKKQTEYLAVPYKMTELTLPETISAVNVTENNQLRELTLKAKILDELPEVAYKNLNNCKTVVEDDLLISFIKKNYKSLSEGKGNSVAAGEPDITYTVENDVIISNKGKVCKVLDTGRTTLTLPVSTTLIEKDALNEATALTTVLMPSTGNIAELETGCLKDTNITTIRCYSGRQYEYIKDHVADAGASDNLRIELVGISQEGYSVEEIGGGNKMLYGLDQDGTPWLGIRSGRKTTGEVNLPGTTRELFRYAMGNMKSDTGSFSIDWKGLTSLGALNTGAFIHSDLAGSVSLENVYIGDMVFVDTKITEASILGNDFLIGENHFKGSVTEKILFRREIYIILQN